jgi:hypothetical protein
MQAYKVVHAKDDVETIYLVTASSNRDAVTQVLDALYQRTHSLGRAPQTPEERDRDVFGLWSDEGEWTNRAMCRNNGCSVSATIYTPDMYKLYTLDRKTGAMT